MLVRCEAEGVYRGPVHALIAGIWSMHLDSVRVGKHAQVFAIIPQLGVFSYQSGLHAACLRRVFAL